LCPRFNHANGGKDVCIDTAQNSQSRRRRRLSVARLFYMIGLNGTIAGVVFVHAVHGLVITVCGVLPGVASSGEIRAKKH
jgi:hypothetical protein